RRLQTRSASTARRLAATAALPTIAEPELATATEGGVAMDAVEFEAQGLYDPNAPNAGDRLPLLEWMTERGITIAQMVGGHERDHLTGLAGDLALRPGERFTCTEVAEKAGLSVEDVQRLTLTIGRPVSDPDEPAFTAADVEVFQNFGAAA